MALKSSTYETYEEWIPDYETTNYSFISLASILYKKGIANNSFFLKLYDEDLQGVDPFDDDLSFETQRKIIVECARNPWYFFREVVRIPAGGHGDGLTFGLHRGNLAALWAYEHNINSFLVMPRQFGKTWSCLVFFLWMFNFSSSYTKMLFLNKALTDSQENLKRLKDARDLLPKYLQLKSGWDEDKGKMTEFTDNVNSLKNAHHNEIITKASARNDQAADKLGRGLTLPFIWFDEFGFLSFNQTIWDAALPAWSKASTVAKDAGQNSAIMITTTPGDRGTPHGSFAHDMKERAAKFYEGLYDKDGDEVVQWLIKNTGAETGFMYIEFHYTQLGLADPEKYYNEQCQLLNYNFAKIRREILLHWTNSVSNSPFDPDDLVDLASMKLLPSDNLSFNINKFYRLNVYRELNPCDKYLITVDPAKARGGKADNTAIVVTNAETGLPHAMFKSNTIKYKETYRFLYTLITRHIPNSVIIVENNIGDTIIEYIKECPTLRHLLYYEFTKDPTKDKKRKGFLQPNKNTDSIIYGVNTNKSNRYKYFDILFDYVVNNKEMVNASEMLEEIETLEYKTNDRVEHASGCHDDMLLSYLIGQWVMMYGNNKARFGLIYGDMFNSDPDDRANSRDMGADMFDNRKHKSNSLVFKSPFLNELLVKRETLDDIEKRMMRSINRTPTKNLFEAMQDSENEMDLFNSEKDAYGLVNIDDNAFLRLNGIGRKQSKKNNSSGGLDVFDEFEKNDFW